MIDIKVPAVGESINEVTLVKWLKNDGQYVDRDEVIAELESEKATFEVNAEKAGVLQTVGKEGDTLKIGDVLAHIDETAAKPEGQTAAQANGTAQKVDAESITPTGTGGKILKNDVLEALAHPGRTPGKALFTRQDRREKMSNL